MSAGEAVRAGAPGVPAEATPVLEARDLTVLHGQLPALQGVSLEVQTGQAYAIIGANGAGKSTLLRTLAGLHTPAAGSVVLDGTDVTRERPERRLAQGIALVPEGRRLFGSLSLEENILVGTYHARPGPWNMERVFELFRWMPSRRRQAAWQLSGGEQQAVAISRALVANPRILLLDELSLGLSPAVVRRIYALLPDLLAAGTTVLLVEQDVGQALAVASRIQCLLEGRTTLVGSPSEFTGAQIEAAYFGLDGSAPDRSTRPSGAAGP
ncbi:MAG: ABC transporter ATP-binding protein [Actinomycetota bacterium]